MPLTTAHPVYLQSGNPETENVQTMLYPGQLGSCFEFKQPAVPSVSPAMIKGYQIVQVDPASAAPAAAAVAWWSNEQTYLVTTNPAALGRGRVAGVFQFAVTPGWFGCIQNDGVGNVKLVATPTSAPVANSGQFIIPSATAGQADCLAAGTAPTYPAIGVVAGALNGTNNTVPVDITVPINN